MAGRSPSDIHGRGFFPLAGSSSALAALPDRIEADSTPLRSDRGAGGLHQNPDLQTRRRTARWIRKIGANSGSKSNRVAKNGVVALRRGGNRPVVALRADMDALPVEEAGDLPFKSKQPGVMHACGHDAHTAIGLGVATLFAKHKAELPGTIKFLFQPAEEGMPVHYTEDWGAKLMIREGAFDNPTPQSVFALHCQPLAATRNSSGTREEIPLRAGQIGYRIGPISANTPFPSSARQNAPWFRSAPRVERFGRAS